MQLTLFNTGHTCSHCGKDAGHKGHTILWNGFFDKDTKQKVCWQCQQTHYNIKSTTPYANQYSETPLIIN